MSEKDQYFDKIVEEPVPPDIDRQTIDGDISCSSINIPSTADVEQMMEDITESETSKRSKRKITEDEHDDIPAKQVNQSAKRKKNLPADINNNEQNHLNQEQQPIKLPTNYTLNSSGEGKIILINPDDNDIFKYPSKFSAAFQNTLFGKANIKDIRINRLKGLIVVEVSNSSEIEKYNLLAVKQIGEWAVKCYRPIREVSRIGVIAPIDISEDITLIQDQIQTERDIKVVKVERLMKNTKEGKIPSTAVKITFEGRDIPKHLKINHFFYSVRPFVQNPVQCYRCQRLGHTAGACKASRPRCLVCAKDHLVGDCIPNNPDLRCANCNGNHKANSRECNLIKQAYEIEKRRAAGESYSEARNNTENRTSMQNIYNVITTEADVHHSLNSQIGRPMSYSDVTKRSNINNTYQSRIPVPGSQDNKSHSYSYNIIRRGTESTCKQCNQTERKEIGTQTEQYTDEQKERISLIKLRNCLTEVLSSNIWKECNNNRKKIIEGAMRNAFGIDLNEQDEISSELETEDKDVENDTAEEDGVLSSENEVFKGDKIEKQNRTEREKNIKNPTNNQNRNQIKISGDLNKKRSNFMKIRSTGNKSNGNNISKDSIKRKDLRNQNKS
jgi:hypothetical protein